LEYPELEANPENEKIRDELEKKKGREAVSELISWDRVASLDLSDMPTANIQFAGVAERLGGVLFDIIILFAATIVFLICACWRVNYYKVN
jgi:hypothetical protein